MYVPGALDGDERSARGGVNLLHRFDPVVVRVIHNDVAECPGIRAMACAKDRGGVKI
jgi:hypothetical protein